MNCFETLRTLRCSYQIFHRSDKASAEKVETLEHAALLQLAKETFVKDSAWTE